MGFTGSFVPLNISGRQRLDDVCKTMARLPFDRTDCSIPMVYAQVHEMSVDTFVIITDNETWAGNMHPSEALARYRQKSGINAKLIVMGMTATGFTIANPNDPGMLDIVGFDSAVPALIRDFMMN